MVNMIRVLLVDDHTILRQALSSLLQCEGDFEVIGEAADGQEAIDKTHELRPDVVVMDISMPRLNGIDATRRIAEQLPDVRVVGLSMHEDNSVRQSMLDAGAHSYVTKGGPPDALFAAIRGEPMPK